VLTASSLPCLATVPTVNITAGCAHDCAYCYIKGYSHYPGDRSVVLYSDTADRVAQELNRKRSMPRSVYFCPSSDPFQPIAEVLKESYRTMRVLLGAGVGIEFVTKGVVPGRFLRLFADHRDLVSGQVGLITLDDDLNRVLEPGAPSAKRRLATVRRLLRAGVATSLRMDPIIRGVTDADQQLDRLFSAARDCGIRSVSASFLFLRPAIVASLRRRLAGDDLLMRILRPFDGADRTCLRGGVRSGLSLPAETRRLAFSRIGALARRNGLSMRICGCKNSDIVRSRCGLVRAPFPGQKTRTRHDSPPGLWPVRSADSN
jgi:DNA repair photolyase